MAIAIKPIDYDKLLENVDQMINLLEYDGMRSSGKTKLNAANLVDLYQLKDRYEANKGSTTVVAEPAPEKKPVGRPPKAN